MFRLLIAHMPPYSTTFLTLYPKSLHWTPYEDWWQPPATESAPCPKPQRIYEDFHSSAAFIAADADIQAGIGCEPPDGCTLPRAIFGWAEMSDGTHLASFSDAKATPAYAMCLNQGGRLRLKLKARSVETTHFFPDVSVNFMRSLDLLLRIYLCIGPTTGR